MVSEATAVVLTAAAELFDVLLDAGQFADLGRLHHRVVGLEPAGRLAGGGTCPGPAASSTSFMAVEPGLTLPPELGEHRRSRPSVDRDIDRYLLVIAAIHERTMKDGTTQRLVDNLRRAVASLDGVDDGTSSCGTRVPRSRPRRCSPTTRSPRRTRSWSASRPSVSRLRGSAPSLQSELEHRRLLSALAKGDFEDVLAAIALAEQRDRRTRGEPRSPWATASSAGGSPSSAGTTQRPGELLAARTGEDTLYPALGALLGGGAPAGARHARGAGSLHGGRRPGHRHRGRARSSSGGQPCPRPARRPGERASRSRSRGGDPPRVRPTVPPGEALRRRASFEPARRRDRGPHRGPGAGRDHAAQTRDRPRALVVRRRPPPLGPGARGTRSAVPSHRHGRRHGHGTPDRARCTRSSCWRAGVHVAPGPAARSP